jgi:uncharacterized membrane protein
LSAYSRQIRQSWLVGIVRPVLATVTAYSVGLFIHVLAVVLAFGPTFGYGFFIGFADTKAPAAVPAIHRAIRLVNLYLVTPAMIVVLAAGIYLMVKGDWGNQSWITIGFIAIIVLFGLVHAYFNPRTRKAIELAERDLAAGGDLSAEYSAVSAQMARVGQLAGLIVVVTIFFMVVKP